MLVSTNKNQHGFTLVELNISLIILGIIVIGIFTTFTNYFVQLERNNISLNLVVEAQGILRSMSDELRYGAGVRQTNTITDPNGPSGGWNTSNTSFVVITAMPAVDVNNNYILDPYTNKPYLNEYVYYKNGRQLYKRLLANTNATGNSISTTCPPNLASSTCRSDILLSKNVDSMSFNLYDQDNNSTTDPLLARSITININMAKDTFGAPITQSNSVRATLRNTF